MTGEHILLLIAITSAMTAVTAIRKRSPSWAVVNGAFFAASAAGYAIDPPRAGVWLLGPYLLFVVVPMLAMIQLNRSLAARRFGAAALFARVALLLHPSKGHRRLIRLVEVQQLVARGDLDEAIAILRDLDMQADLQLEILRLQNRWTEIIEHVERAEGDRIERHGVVYIRALGETGQLDRMLEVYRDASTRWARRDDMAEELASIRLFVAAFLGQPAVVQTICDGPLRHYGSSIKLYWLATSHEAGGDRERAAAAWAELQHDEEARMRAAAAYRADHPPVRVDRPTEAMSDVIAQLATDVRDQATYAGRAPVDAPRAVLSYVLVLILFAVHLTVWLQQQRDSFELYQQGIFWSPAVLDGEWWRIVTATFLHANWLHFTLNALGLIWFGPFVERFLGRVRFGIVYLVGGIGGFTLLAALDALDLRDATAALGASGCIMAVIGASTGIFLRGSTRSPVAAARLRDMLVFVAMQVVFDVLAPQVSMTGHLSGLVIGFGIGILTKTK